eukprot:gene13813-biopygen6982
MGDKAGAAATAEPALRTPPPRVGGAAVGLAAIHAKRAARGVPLAWGGVRAARDTKGLARISGIDTRPEKRFSDPVPQSRLAMQKGPNGEDPRKFSGNPRIFTG